MGSIWKLCTIFITFYKSEDILKYKGYFLINTMTLKIIFFLFEKMKGKVPSIVMFNVQNINHCNYIHLSREISKCLIIMCRGGKGERIYLLGAIIEKIN